jgi:type II secretory pathway pseudopilin PulG
MSRLRNRLAGCDREAGLTLIELLVAAAMSVILVGAACMMLISAVRGQPKLSKKSQNVSTARYVLERMTREIRNGIVVYSASGSKVEFKTRVRRTACGGGVEEDPGAAAIECRVTYECTTTTCTRRETEPEVLGAGGTPTTVVSGLDSSSVFNYEYAPEAAEGAGPSYIGVTLHIANPDGDGELTITDGAGLRAQSYITES